MNPEEQLNEARKLWDFIKPNSKNEYLEIRLKPPSDPEGKRKYYENFNVFKSKSKSVIKKGCQVFIKNFSELEELYKFNDGYLINNYKTCYGLNLREMNKVGEINGGYDSVKNARFVYFDVDKMDHSNIKDYERPMLKQFIDGIIYYMKRFGLNDPTLVSSGAGMHIIYKITSNTKCKRTSF